MNGQPDEQPAVRFLEAAPANAAPAQPALAPPVPPIPPQQAPRILPVGPGATVFRTYREYYTYTDPFGGNYAQALEPFSVPLDQAAAITLQALAAQILAPSPTLAPVAFLKLCRPVGAAANNPGQVCCFHRPQRFEARFGLPATPWDDTVFAFKGEVVRGQMPAVVNWAPNNFHQVNAQLRVPTNEMAQQLIAANPRPVLVGPFQNGDAGTEVVRVRRTIFVPPPYVPLFLEEDLEPVEAYSRAIAAITADQRVVECEPLLTWLRAAMTQSVGGGAPDVADVSPTVPLVDASLIQHRHQLLLRDLPGLDTTAQQQGQVQALVQGLGQIAGEVHSARTEASVARAASTTKTPAQYFGTRLDTILRLCNAPDTAALPELYTELADNHRRQSLTIIQQHVDMSAEALGYGAQDLHVTVTPAVGRRIADGQWNMTDPDNLETGVHPFHFTQRSPTEQQVLRQLADTHSMIHGEDGARPSLADAQALAAFEKVALPVTWSQARRSLQAFHCVCHAALGAGHAQTQAFARIVRDYTANENRCEQLRPPTGYTAVHGPALLLRWIQLRFVDWSQDQTFQSVAVPSEDYGQVFRMIKRYEPWAADFPPGYLQMVSPPPVLSPLPSPTVPPPPARGPPAAASSSAQPTPRPDAAPSNSRVNNTVWKALFEPFKTLAVRTRDLRLRLNTQGTALPKRTDGQTRCLAYHVKGLCNTNCTHKADHVPANQADDTVLLQWCQEHYKE